MQILKALVVIMGVLIIAGFWIIGSELYRRATDPERRTEAVERSVPATGTPQELALGLPSGARIEEMLAVGSRVLLRVTVPDAADRVYVMDPRNGTVTLIVTAGQKDAVP